MDMAAGIAASAHSAMHRGICRWDSADPGGFVKNLMRNCFACPLDHAAPARPRRKPLPMLHAILEILMLLGLIPGKEEAESSRMHAAMRTLGLLIVLTIAGLAVFFLVSW
jgi:hypothetical protein